MSDGDRDITDIMREVIERIESDPIIKSVEIVSDDMRQMLCTLLTAAHEEIIYLRKRVEELESGRCSGCGNPLSGPYCVPCSFEGTADE